MNIKIDNALFRGAHACSVLVSAFCRDELLLHAALRVIASFEQSSRLAKAFGVASTLQACAPRNSVATTSSHVSK
jgi:hypothetical protein